MSEEKQGTSALPIPVNEDETDISEITIQADGRIYVFGASKQVLDLLRELNPFDDRLSLLMGLRRKGEEVVSISRCGVDQAS